VPWISIAIPTRERRSASRDDAVTILSLIFAVSGDLTRNHKRDASLSSQHWRTRTKRKSGKHNRKTRTRFENKIIKIGASSASGKRFFFWIEDDVPLVKDDLVAPAALLFFKLKVVHTPATLVFRQICDKIIVILRRRLFFYDDLRLFLVEYEDDVLGRLLEFQLLEHIQTIWVYGYTGRLGKHYIGSTGMPEQTCLRTISVLCC
jgi:hypothetical protein